MVIVETTTYIDNIENVDIELTSNDHLVKSALISDLKIDDTLHIITVISNVCEFKRRTQLMHEFIARLSKVDNIVLYVVELAYGNQEYSVTNKENPHHLQLRTKHALWHKENMINVGIKKLLPVDWKAVAWIDGDVEFENPNWVNDTLKVLTKCDTVQMFTTCFDLDENNIPMSVFQSFGYKYAHGVNYKNNTGINYWHTGYAWAYTRSFYDKIEKIYEKCIIGSGDYIIGQAFLKNVTSMHGSLIGFSNDIQSFVSKMDNVIIGYIPTNILHYFHGSKKNRRYIERNQIMISHHYDPNLHICYNDDGIIEPTKQMSQQFIDDILEYFKQRNEDEYYDIINQQ